MDQRFQSDMLTVDEAGAQPLPKAERGRDPRAIILDPIGDLIAERYRVVQEVGRGGMGIVYQAMDEKLNRLVAVKRLIPNASNLSRDQRRFAREAQTVAGLGHIYIVAIHDIGQDGIGHFITMEYVEGPALKDGDTSTGDPVTLSRYVKKVHPLTPEESADLTAKLCNALEYAHRQGIVHRDIKPGNVLLTPKMDPKLVDFGLARPIHSETRDDITLQGQFVGTPEYVAPEQWTSNDIDRRADIFSLGAVMWFAISGRVPRHFDPKKVPPGLQPILQNALAQRPSERYQTMEEFAEALMNRSDRSGKASITGTLIDDSNLLSTLAGSSTWHCINCDKMNPDKAKFCVHCGAKGTSDCPVCSNEVRTGVQYCPSCGCDMKVAKDYAAAVEEAKRSAGFKEYEAALQTLRGISNSNNSDVAALIREWREVILERRNLLNEFDGAIRVFNVNGAVELQQKLTSVVPTECLSDSPDFETAARYNALVNQLDRLLRDAVDRSRKDHNMAQYSTSINSLNLVYGKDRCVSINEELWKIQNDLNHTVTQAGLAIGMNCISFSFELLNASDPWHSDELGDRRSRLLKNCRSLLEERARAIEAIEEALREGAYTEALRRLKAMSRFRLPPRNSEMRPAREDMAAHDRIVDIDKILTTKILDIVPGWISEDEWASVGVALEGLKAGDHTTWRRCEDQVRSLVNREIARRYNRAVDVERKGRISQAQRAWEYFRLIPRELITGNLYQYARDFDRRRKVVLLTKRQRTITRTILFSCVLWLVPVWGLVQNGETFTKNVATWLPEMTFALVNGLVFAALLMIIGRKRLSQIEMARDVDAPSIRLGILSGIVALAPLGCAMTYALSFLLDSKLGLLMLVITPIWLIYDMQRHSLLRMPSGPALAGSWLVLSLATLVLPALRSLETDGKLWILWPVLALTHCFLYMVVMVIDGIIHRDLEEQDDDEDDEDEEYEYEEPLAAD